VPASKTAIMVVKRKSLDLTTDFERPVGQWCLIIQNDFYVILRLHLNTSAAVLNVKISS
jgi:hypothetical protein